MSRVSDDDVRLIAHVVYARRPYQVYRGRGVDVVPILNSVRIDHRRHEAQIQHRKCPGDVEYVITATPNSSGIRYLV